MICNFSLNFFFLCHVFSQVIASQILSTLNLTLHKTSQEADGKKILR